MLRPLQRTPVSETRIFFSPTTSFNPRSSNGAKARETMNVSKCKMYCLIKLQPSASALCSSQPATANLRAPGSSPAGQAARLLRGRPRATPFTRLAAHLGEAPARPNPPVPGARCPVRAAGESRTRLVRTAFGRARTPPPATKKGLSRLARSLARTAALQRSTCQAARPGPDSAASPP